MEQIFLNRYGKQADYSFHKCTVTVLSYWHRLTITCLPGSLAAVCFICQQCSTSKLLKYYGLLQWFTVWSLHENQTTVWHFSAQAGACICQQDQGPLNHIDNTGSAAVTSTFIFNQLMNDLPLLQCMSLYKYCIHELYKKQTH
jgi:hypothetical protein